MAKSIIVNTPKVNRAGYRVLSEGIDFANFLKNPVMLFNHHRTWKGEEIEMLPIGYWENLRIVNGNLIADPVFDEPDKFALKIKNKFEKGVLRAASIGFTPILISEETKDLLPGQTRPTVVKCELKEISIVDIPGNPDAVVLSDNDSVLELSDNAESPLPLLTQKTEKKMDQLKLIALALGLEADAGEAKVMEAVNALKASKEAAQARVAALEKENKSYRDEQKKYEQRRNEQLVDAAINAGKIQKTSRQTYLKLASDNYQEVKNILDGMKAVKTLADYAGRESGGEKSGTMSFTEMSKKDPRELLRLRKEEPEMYKQLYREEYGKDPVSV